MPKNIVIFDLDGTLADTAPDLIAVLNRITQPFSFKPATLDQVGQLVGHGAKAMIEKAFALNNTPLTEETHEILFKEFLEDYASNLANETYLFDGALEALSHFRSQGFTLAVCTNKPEEMARMLIAELGIADFFTAITGGDTFPFRKPDARHLTETLKLAGGNFDKAIMVGDSATDINTAKNANLPSIAVTFGYSDVPVDTLGADIIIRHFNELSESVDQLFES